MFSTPETSVHVQDKNREISPLERERERERERESKVTGERIWRKGYIRLPIFLLVCKVLRLKSL